MIADADDADDGTTRRVRRTRVKENNERDASVRGERDEIGAGVRESGEKKRPSRARVWKVLWSARALDDADVPDAWTTGDGDDGDGEWVEPDAAGER